MLDPLLAMANPGPAYGLVVIDQKECTIGILRGKHVQRLSHAESNIQGKHHHGGQSSVRFERTHDHEVHEWFKRMGERVNERLREAQGILVGGPGYTKEKWTEGDYLHYELRGRVLKPLVDVGDTTETGLRELVARGAHLIEGLDIARERQLVARFLTTVGKGGAATYGKMMVADALRAGRVETLLLSETLPVEVIRGHAALAEATGATLELISPETEEGKQLARAFGGYGALLRY